MNVEKALFSFMQKIAEENCYTNSLELSTPIFETELMDSLSILRLIVFIDEEFSVSLTLDDINSKNIKSMATMIKLIKTKLSVKQ